MPKKVQDFLITIIFSISFFVLFSRNHQLKPNVLRTVEYIDIFGMHESFLFIMISGNDGNIQKY